MAQDTTISTETVITLNNFSKTLEKVNFHIDNAWSPFKKIFPEAEVPKAYKLQDIIGHERIARAIGPVLEEKDIWSELLYGIQFERVKLQTQIWINNAHPKAQEVLQKAKETGSFKYWEDEYGIGIFLDCKLYQFIESERSDQEIQDWFKESFQTFREFIDSTPELEWDKKVLKTATQPAL